MQGPEYEALGDHRFRGVRDGGSHDILRIEAGKKVIISGKIRLPDNAGTTSNYKVYTYSNQDDDDIRTKGDIIDKKTDVPGTAIDGDPPSNTDVSVTPFIESTFLRKGFVGPLKLHLKSTAAIIDSSGFISVVLPKSATS
jgi:hypothetical protein